VSLNPIRVFIVDDHPLVREWLGNLLRLEADLMVAGESDESNHAVQTMLALDPAPQVAVVDLSLKRGSGLDLIKAMRQSLPHTRALVLSMHEEIGDVERAFRAGARGYVMKHESTAQIVPAIRQVHAGKIYAAPAVLARLRERKFGLAAGTPGSAQESLSDREMEVFRRLGAGQSTRRIAEDLGVNQKTVQTYCTRIKEKLALEDSAELIRAAVRMHTTPP
jgi:DNA-binding NarL/FixJ family response regulator